MNQNIFRDFFRLFSEILNCSIDFRWLWIQILFRRFPDGIQKVFRTYSERFQNQIHMAFRKTFQWFSEYFQKYSSSSACSVWVAVLMVVNRYHYHYHHWLLIVVCVCSREGHTLDLRFNFGKVASVVVGSDHSQPVWTE